MSELMMLAAFALIICAAMGIYTLLQITSAESMVLSVVWLIAVMHAAVSAGHMQAGVWVYGITALLGAVLFMLRCSRERKGQFASPALAALTLLYLAGIVLFKNAQLQNIDDFHQWAAAVKYILEKGHMPGDDFLGASNLPMHSSVYHVYFQLLGGYHEGHMYVSSMLLSAVPLMLPIANKKWKDLGRSIWYVLAAYIGMFHLYNHPYKSLYVDLPAAAWTAGIAVWFVWIARQREAEKGTARGKGALAKTAVIGAKASSWIFLIAAMWITIEIKRSIGLLLAAFTVLYMLLVLCIDRMEQQKQTERVYARDEKAAKERGKWVRIILLVLVLALAALIMLIVRYRLIPVSLAGVKEALTFGSEKSVLTAKQLKDNFFAKKLFSKSNLNLTLYQAAAGITLLTLLLAGFAKGKTRKILVMQSIFTPAVTLLYTAALYVTYVSNFSYEESVANAAVHRYFAVIALYLFFLMMAAFTNVDQEAAVYMAAGNKPIRDKGAEKTLSLVRGMLLLILIGGLSKYVITEGSSFRGWAASGYTEVKTAKERMAEAETIVGEDETVYLLYQTPTLEDMDEYTMCTLLYYWDDHISNYMNTPWKFTEDGSLRWVLNADYTLEDLPKILQEGAYDYLWVYESDDYLDENLGTVLDIDGDVQQGLYEIERDSAGNVKGISLTAAL